MTSKKFENLEVRLEEESIYSRTDDNDIFTGGIGIVLKATISDDKGNTYNLFEGQIRGIGRYGDDSRHWYREIENIWWKDGRVHVTLNSGLLRDTYAFNPHDGNVELSESVDLEELKKQERMKEAIENLKGKPLNEVVRKFGEIVAEKYKSSGTAGPKVLKTAVDEERDMGIVVVGRYTEGYDSAINKIELYAVRPDGSFHRLEDVRLNSYGYGRPKFSSTFFRVKNLRVMKGKVELEGVVMQDYLEGMISYVMTLDRITQEWNIGDSYKKLEEILQ